jgi:hypothetical protein
VRTIRVLPIDFVEKVLCTQEAITHVAISVFRYVPPQSLQDVRKVYWVSPQALRAKFMALNTQLAEDEEIAFHSVVRVRDESVEHHFPLVDFKTPERARVEASAATIVAEYGAVAGLFASGNSYHLYIATLLQQPEWVRFMGRILLLNPRSAPEVVDARWVGHRLMGGFAALRWTANGSRYSGVPSLVREWPDGGPRRHLK